MRSNANKEYRQVDGGNVAVVQLTERQKAIVSLILKKTNITAKQMAVIAGIPQRTVERELSVLKRAGVIMHQGSPRGGSWVVLCEIE